MARILLRAGKAPGDVVSPGEVYWEDLIARNSGNILFAHSAYKMLSAPGVQIDVTRYRNPRPHEADEINEKYDSFVIPLANAFRPDFEGQLKALTALVKKLRIPCIVVGIGAQAELDADPAQRRRTDETAKAFLSAVLDRSASVGVRGEFTKAYLNSLGFDAVKVIGCPSMFLYGDQLPVARKVPSIDQSTPIAVNLTGGMPANMAHFFDQTFATHPNAHYMPQNRADLAMLLWGQTPKTGQQQDSLPRSPDHPIIASGRARFFTDVTRWIEFLGTKHFSFGTRIHGNVFALLAGTPACVIAHDSRTLELARYFEIPHRKVTEITADTTVESLYAESDVAPLVKNHPARFDVYRSFLEENGIDHIFRHAGAAEAFERQLAAVALPEGVAPATMVERDELLKRTIELAQRSSKRVEELESELANLRKNRPAGAPGPKSTQARTVVGAAKRSWWPWK